MHSPLQVIFLCGQECTVAVNCKKICLKTFSPAPRKMVNAHYGLRNYVFCEGRRWGSLWLDCCMLVNRLLCSVSLRSASGGSLALATASL